MNIVKKASVALAVASMTLAPVAASAATAAESLSVTRAAASTESESNMKGGSIILALLAAAALPAPAADHARMGYVTATKSDGTFTFGTTALNAANSTVAYTDYLTVFNAATTVISASPAIPEYLSE